MIDSQDIHSDWTTFFETVHTDNSWITPILDAIAGIDAKEAAWKPASGLSSIWEIVAHASGHLSGLLADLNGTNGIDILDWPPVENENQGAWEATVRHFVSQTQQLERHVRGHSVEDLYSPPAGSRKRRSVRLAEIFVHHAYHAGQIVKMRQLHAAMRTLSVAS